MERPEISAQDRLRADILAIGLDDFVSMADVQACIFDGVLADFSTETRQLVVNTVRSLLEDGLVVVGDIPGPNDPGFNAWPGTVDEVMTRFVDIFVGRHEDPIQWQYRIWLALTAKGEQASEDAVRAGDPEPQDDSIHGDAVFNAEINAAVEEKLAGSHYGMLLSERGITTVALNEDGEIVEYRAQGPLVPTAEEGDAISLSDRTDPASQRSSPTADST